VQPTVPADKTLKRKADDMGAEKDGEHLTRPAKRQQTPSHSSNESENSILSWEALEQAKRFKKYYATYAKLHRELSTSPEPAADKVRQVHKMHMRLSTMKMDIVKAAAVA